MVIEYSRSVPALGVVGIFIAPLLLPPVVPSPIVWLPPAALLLLLALMYALALALRR